MSLVPISYGTGSFDRTIANDYIVQAQVRNPKAVLKLGGSTFANAANTYLGVQSRLDGIHLTETTGTQVFVDTGLTITQPTTMTGNMTLQGNLSVGGTSTLTGAATLSNTLNVAKAATFQLTVATGALTSSSASVTGTLGVGGATTLAGAATVNNTLTVQSAATFQSTVQTGALSAASAAVSANTTVGGTLTVTGASSLNNTLAVTGAATLASTLAVTGNSSFSNVAASGTLSVQGNASVTGTTALTGATTISSNLTVAGASGVAVTAGRLTVGATSLAYDSAAGAGYWQMGTTTGVKLFAADNHVELPGGAVTTTITGYAGSELKLAGGDAKGTVHIAGQLLIDGDISRKQVSNLDVEDLTLNLGKTVDANGNNTSTDQTSDTAGLVVSGNSAYEKSIRWHYNQGPAYAPPDASHYTDDGLSYWTVQGGNLVLTRTIPAANHVSYNYSQSAWQKDNTAATVSFRFSITDAEDLVISKTQGIDYSAGNNTTQVGSTAKVLSSFDIPPTTDGTTS
ncbi:hypothetical protein WJX74_000243 [Apatococcus lobatus]|uniref:Uncharacterized protein n=1 Tax=Apatococcus lobatus TaxID=904363 RepID=A0AAW1QZK4_9CHLO